MSKYNTQMQRIWKKYENAGNVTPATAKDVAAWAIENGLWQPRPADVVSQCAEDLARALREEYRTDKKGRKYRTKHAVRLKRDGVQLSFWADINTAPRAHMEMAFAQRRRQIIGDCYQLCLDVDHYNDVNPSEPPVQLILDFTHDVEELMELDGAA